jgi:hypothetical protein
MGAGEAIVDAIAGGLSGVYGDYSEQRKRRDRLAEVAEQNRSREDDVKRKVAKDTADETERQRQIAAQQEIIESLPDTMPDGSPNTMKTALRVQYASPRGNMGGTILTEAGRNARYDRPSGNTVANIAGAMDRVGAQIKGAWDRTMLEEGGRNSRWAAPSGNATLGSETTRRGQDIGATTARRGQDLTFSLGSDRNALTQRGQDIDFGLGTDRNAIQRKRNALFDATFNDQPDAAPAAAPTTPAAAPPPPVVRPAGGGGPTVPSAAVRAPLPVTPHAAAPQALAVLTSQAEATLRAFKAEQDPAKRTQLQKQLLELKQRKDALVATGGGQ